MNIAFDTWVLAKRFRNMGIHVYAEKLLAAFADSAHKRGILIRPFADDAYPTVDKFDKGAGVKPLPTRLLRRERVWRLGGAALSARSNDIDLVFCPTYNTITAGFVPFVTTIHDVTPVTMPAAPPSMIRRQRIFMWLAAKFSKALITDSECSKKDLVETYGLAPSKISVIYLGFDRNHFNLTPPHSEQLHALRAQFQITKPYIFHHGTVQPRKNLVRLMEAFQMMLKRNRTLEMQLVLCGSFGWYADSIRAFVKDRELGLSVVFTGPLPDEDLSVLLKGSEMAVIPSLYEGFCLPMVEAMASGVPTIGSRTSCIPEVSGGVLQYFDPTSAEEMSYLIESVLKDDRARRELIEKGIERSSVFSWDRCAADTLDALVAAGV